MWFSLATSFLNTIRVLCFYLTIMSLRSKASPAHLCLRLASGGLKMVLGMRNKGGKSSGGGGEAKGDLIHSHKQHFYRQLVNDISRLAGSNKN